MKIMIVDDEISIVEGLKMMIRRELPECRVIGTAYNGVDGAALALEKKPDIVITDIRMPRCDGLRMIEQLQAAGDKAKYIILSGYADFEYAKKGMQMGVQCYITKPVEEDDLRDSVRSTMTKIGSERAKKYELQHLKTEIRLTSTERALREMIDSGGEPPAELQELLLSASRLPASGFRTICSLIELEVLSKLAPDPYESAYAAIEDSLCSYAAVYRFRYGPQIVLVVCHGRELDEQRYLGDMGKLKSRLSALSGITVSLGVGTVRKGVGGIGRSFEEARQALSYKVLHSGDEVLSYSGTVAGAIVRSAVPGELIAGLEACIESENTAGSEEVIHTIFEDLASAGRLSLADLQVQCLNILLVSIRKMPFQQLQQNDTLGQSILSLESLSRFRTLEQLKEWLTSCVARIIELKSLRNTEKKKDVITEIKSYVEEHYGQSISLAELSTRFFINPYYLSQLFKQKTGDTYLNYLVGVRMGKAKELLEKTELKVYEISQKVGYSDANHFAKLFERHVGCKPTEYRKGNR